VRRSVAGGLWGLPGIEWQQLFRVRVASVDLDLTWACAGQFEIEIASLGIGIGPRVEGLLAKLAALTLRSLLRLGPRHPGSAAVLGSGVLGLDAAVGHNLYDTCCLLMTRKTFGKTISDRPITDGQIDELVAKAEAGYPVEETVKGADNRRSLTAEVLDGVIRTPAVEKPALSDAQRSERLRRLAERLRRLDGLDREVLKHLERLTGDEE